jgi:hypothetical protein
VPAHKMLLVTRGASLSVCSAGVGEKVSLGRQLPRARACWSGKQVAVVSC